MSLEVRIEKKLKNMTLKSEFELADGQGILGILGASGCGKSMTLKCIAGIEKPDRGRIVLNGRVIYDSELGIDVQIQKRRVGYLFQNYALFPHMTVGRNIWEAACGTRSEKRQAVKQWLKLLEIEELEDALPGRLSGGQQQRAALARVLASQPEVLMLDEPFSALDEFLKESVQLNMLKILGNYKGDVLMVSHSRDEIYRFCECVCVLDRGETVVSGETKEVFRVPGATAAARLTGCKNIGTVHILEGRAAVPEWGNCLLKLPARLPAGVTHVGIRAHDLREPEQEETNQICCESWKMIEDLFEVTVIVNGCLWWKVPRDIWKERYREQVPPRLEFPQESLLWLSDRPDQEGDRQ